MNPNSTHQTWSLWTAYIAVPFHRVHATVSFENEMRRVSAGVYRKLFGSASEMRITRKFIGKMTQFVVECRTEGSPVQEPDLRRRRMDQIAEFFGRNLRKYGDVDIRVDVQLQAGDPGDGKPRSQLILAPPLKIDEKETIQ